MGYLPWTVDGHFRHLRVVYGSCLAFSYFAGCVWKSSQLPLGSLTVQFLFLTAVWLNLNPNRLIISFKLFGLTNDPLKTICEQSASPKVCQKRNWNPSKVNKRNTNSSGTDQKETHYKLAINGMPPQILTKSSGKRHQHISDIDKSGAYR